MTANGDGKDAAIVEISHVSRRFADTLALDDVSLTLRSGGVYGLVGANGAGKTTLLRHILGLLRAKSGTVRVFGIDPVKDPVAVLSRVGYLSEDRDLPDWMRLGDLLTYTRAYYPKWDQAYAEELMRTFGLNPRSVVKTLSRGMRAQAALIVAVAHRPDLLVLDEPSTGLDAVVRRDILAEIVRVVADEGRAVLFSSHLLDEVERMSDHVSMIHEGRLVLSDSLDDVRAQHTLVSITFDAEPQKPMRLSGALSVQGEGRAWTAIFDNGSNGIADTLASMGGRIVEKRNASLEEIFVARVGRRCDAETEA